MKKTLLGLALATSLLLPSTPTLADPSDPIGTVHAAGQNHFLPRWKQERFVATAAAESRFNPSARGDRGHSHGLFQLNDEEGLLHDFYRRGYRNPYSAEENADYSARMFAAADHQQLCRWWSGYRVQFC
jgi:hypothetical protein